MKRESADVSGVDLAPLSINQDVYVQNVHSGKWDTISRVVDYSGNRSYIIQSPSGQQFRRNRRFLRPARILNEENECENDNENEKFLMGDSENVLIALLLTQAF